VPPVLDSVRVIIVFYYYQFCCYISVLVVILFVHIKYIVPDFFNKFTMRFFIHMDFFKIGFIIINFINLNRITNSLLLSGFDGLER
jgi:hypothetical protein